MRTLFRLGAILLALSMLTSPFVFAAGDFTLSASPPSSTVTAGASASYTITASPTGGFSGSVTLIASVAPATAGISTSFSKNPVQPYSSTYYSYPDSSMLTVTTGTQVAGGTYTITVTGTSGSLSHSTSVTLQVSAQTTTTSTTTTTTSTTTTITTTTSTSTTTTTSTSSTSSITTSATPTAGPATVTVTLPQGVGSNTNLNFNPPTIRVVIGVNNTISWVDADSVPHTVTSVSVPTGANVFDSGTLTNGGKFSVTLLIAGTYQYHCTFHPGWMRGTIVVLGITTTTVTTRSTTTNTTLTSTSSSTPTTSTAPTTTTTSTTPTTTTTITIAAGVAIAVIIAVAGLVIARRRSGA